MLFGINTIVYYARAAFEQTWEYQPICSVRMCVWVCMPVFVSCLFGVFFRLYFFFFFFSFLLFFLFSSNLQVVHAYPIQTVNNDCCFFYTS